MRTKFYFISLNRKDHLEELTVDGKMDIRKMMYDHVDWIHLAQDREQWRFFLNTIAMNCGNSASKTNIFPIVNK
jgi:hypothetical protein